MVSFLLLSSDDRRRYAEDIQTVLAAPVGSVIQFRYDQKWVTPGLQAAVRDRQAKGSSALLGFSSSRSADPFVLPVRYATVVEAECVAEMYIFKLRIGGYPDLDGYPTSLPELVELSRVTKGELTTDTVFRPATATFPPMPAEVTDRMDERWLGIARRLALHPTFQKSYFLRVAPIETKRNKVLRFDQDGQIETIDGQSLRVVTYIFAEQYASDAGFKLACTPGGTSLRNASDEVYDVALRYDRVEFWLHLAAENFDTLSRVTISLASENAAATTIPAYVRLPLVVSRSKTRMFRRLGAASTGAVLVALPAILGDDSPLAFRIVAALVGAGLLAVSGAAFSSSS
ncbi:MULTISPECIES: hypothetical protein [unclassified Kribbella]|uniref:hypothetical protein n=1 Tax=unclassified Kribbella TaxID=2644121 RepID=UPI00301A4199